MRFSLILIAIFFIEEALSQVIEAPSQLTIYSASCRTQMTYIVRPEATELRVFYKINQSPDPEVMVSHTFPNEGARVFGFPGLNPGLTYSYRAIQIVNNQESESSVTKTFTVPGNLPDLTGVRIDSISSCSWDVFLDPINNPHFVEFDFTQLNNIPATPRNYSPIRMPLSGDNRSWRVTQVDPDTRYQLKIRYSKKEFEIPNKSLGICYSNFTTPIEITTKSTLGSIANPRLDSATLTSTGVRISWDPVPNAGFYRFRLHEVIPGNTSNQPYRYTTTPSIQLVGLKPDGDYQWIAVPMQGSRNPCVGARQAEGRFRLFARDNIPTNLRASVLNHNKATIAWSVSFNGLNTQEINYVRHRKVGEVFKFDSTRTNAIVLNNLTPTTTYEIRVQNKRPVLENNRLHDATSEYSQLFTFTTPPDPCTLSSILPKILTVEKKILSKSLLNPTGSSTSTIQIPSLTLFVTDLRALCTRKVVIEYSFEVPDPLSPTGKKLSWRVWKECNEISLADKFLAVTDPQVDKPAMVKGYRVKIITLYGSPVFSLPAGFY